MRDEQELISFRNPRQKEQHVSDRATELVWSSSLMNDIRQHCWKYASSTFTVIPLWCVDLWVQQSESTSTVDDAGDDVAAAGCCWTSCSDSVPLATLVKSNGSDNNNNNSCCTSLMVAARIIITRQEREREKRLDGTSNSQHSLLYPPSQRETILLMLLLLFFKWEKTGSVRTHSQGESNELKCYNNKRKQACH